MKRFIILVFALALLATHTAYAQRPQHKEKGNPEMRKAIRQYGKENILPAMREQRLKLDAELSAQEKAEIVAVREQLKADKKVMQEKRQKFREAREKGTLDKEAMRAEMKPLREKHEANIAKIRAIAQKHEAKITQLREEIKPQIEKWKADIEKIATENGQGEHAKHIQHRIGKQWNKGVVGFLLMPTEAPKAKKEANADAVRLYPNPAQDTQQIKIMLKEAGAVKIDILDKQGNVIQTVFEGNKTAGEHVFDVNTSRLNTGNYVYQISTPAGKSTKKLIIKK